MTGDGPTKQKVERLVAGFAPTITERFFRDYPLPAYTFDKVNIGLIDAYAFAGVANALAVLNHATDAALPHLPEKALTRPEMAARPHRTWPIPGTSPIPCRKTSISPGSAVRANAIVLSRAGSCSTATISSRWRGARMSFPAGHAYSHVML